MDVVGQHLHNSGAWHLDVCEGSEKCTGTLGQSRRWSSSRPRGLQPRLHLPQGDAAPASTARLLANQQCRPGPTFRPLGNLSLKGMILPVDGSRLSIQQSSAHSAWSKGL